MVIILMCELYISHPEEPRSKQHAPRLSERADIPRLRSRLRHPSLPLILERITKLHHLHVLPVVWVPARILPVQHRRDAACIIHHDIPGSKVPVRKHRHVTVRQLVLDAGAVPVGEAVGCYITPPDALSQGLVVHLSWRDVVVVAE